MMVIPAYLYHDEEMHDITLIGELLAIAALIMALMFVVCDLGRPDRFWHLLPGFGRFNFPVSMLTWDVIVLNGYLMINLHICGYLLYMRFLGRKPNPRWYVPFVFLSILWAISIHTVTAFLYCGLGGRPFWNTALLAPRFLASALSPARHSSSLRFRSFAGRSAAISATARSARCQHHACHDPNQSAHGGVGGVRGILHGGLHTSAAHYLYFGIDGHNALVPWIWASVAMTVAAALCLLCPKVCDHAWVLNTACVLAFIGIWIEKGMGMVIPGFVPSTLHELVEYIPSLLEWKIMAGIWALGLMLYTLALKIAINVFRRSPLAAKAGANQINTQPLAS